MFRGVMSAFIGYAITGGVMATLAVACAALGGAFAFSDDSTIASTPWWIVMLFCGLLAAIAGGCVAARVGGRKGGLAVRVLVALLIVMGSMSFIAQLDAQVLPLPAGHSRRDLTFMEAAQYAVSPMWYNVAIVFVGGFGAWLGGRIGLPSATCKAKHPDAP